MIANQIKDSLLFPKGSPMKLFDTIRKVMNAYQEAKEGNTETYYQMGFNHGKSGSPKDREIERQAKMEITSQGATSVYDSYFRGYDEGRCFARVPFKGFAHLKFDDNYYEGNSVKDISLSAVFVLGSFKHEVEEICKISLTEEKSKNVVSFSAHAKVVRIVDEGIALNFTSMDERSYQFLQAILLYDSHDPFTHSDEFLKNVPFKLTDSG